ncbi:MAG TPA: phosphodiester glycosidase family protein [Candidatus Stackebrandtia excrementipullorum]|nr:phosphodiester glycosidase family protein [Candidatus Stackebrandtia excrementipullorum]
MKTRYAISAAVLAAAIGVGGMPGQPALADTAHHNAVQQVTPGVEYSTYTTSTGHGTARVHLLTIDLTEPGVSLGLLNAGKVAQTGVMTSLADRVDAAAGVNGDFFNIGETGAPVGPAVLDGKDLKGAVPSRQRHGPSLPPGTSNENVFAVTDTGEPVISSLAVDGKATGPDGSFELHGLNQYAITVDGIGVFDAEWGSRSRVRATCGTDDDRNAPCSDRTREVEIVDGVVTRVASSPGSGQIADDATVLVARDDGVDHLADLSEGDEIDVDYRLATPDGATLSTAVGGMPIILDGEHLELNDSASTLAPRSAAGFSADGETVYLVAIDGRSSSSVGATLKSLADIMTSVGAHEAVNFDGGGSTTLVARRPGNTATSVRNSPSDGAQRSVPNGLGVFYSG